MRDKRIHLAGILHATSRRRRPRPRRLLALAGLGLAALGFAMFAEPAPRVVWNASASAPLGLYWISYAAPARGDLVLAELPPDARRLADERGYLPAGIPLVKRVAAQGGDTVCADDETVSINGRPVAVRLARDRLGLALPAWTGCRALAEDELFLLIADAPGSFDGRYFGPVQRTAVMGRLVPLWTE